MGTHIDFPTLDGPLESWCFLCECGSTPRDAATCVQCRTAWERFQAALDRRPRRWLRRRVLAAFGNDHVPQQGNGHLA